MAESTYGEEWYAVKSMFNKSSGIKEAPCIGAMTFTPRMSRPEANKFYRNRSREVFASLGYGLISEDPHPAFNIDSLIIEIRKKTERMLRREARKILMSS